MLTAARLRELIDVFPRLSIGLVGDLFLDRYLEIDAARSETSIETGLEAHQVVRIRNSPGALGTVMNNLAALGIGRIVPVTVIGDDGHGDDLLRELARLPVETQFVLRDSARLTPTYTKPLLPTAHGWRELSRLDVRSRGPLPPAAGDRVTAALRQEFSRCDAWIVLDQIAQIDAGVVTRAVRRELAALSEEYPDKPLLVDSRAHLGEFEFGLLKGNRGEILAAALAANENAEDDEAVVRAASRLQARTCRPVLVTLGEQGLLVLDTSGAATRLAGIAPRGPIDIVGAGDAVTAAAASCLAAGASPLEAAEVGNLAASITIEQVGTTGTATGSQLLGRLADVKPR